MGANAPCNYYLPISISVSLSVIVGCYPVDWSSLSEAIPSKIYPGGFWTNLSLGLIPRFLAKSSTNSDAKKIMSNFQLWGFVSSVLESGLGLSFLFVTGMTHLHCIVHACWFNLWSVHPLWLGGPRQCEIWSFPDTSTHNEHWESNSTFCDLESNALSTWPRATTSHIVSLEAKESVYILKAVTS